MGGRALALEHPGAITVLVDDTVRLPGADIVAGQLVGGLQHDVAKELGRRLGREVRFRVVSRRRVAAVLAEGRDADMICTYTPVWLGGPLRWSQPFLEDADLLVSAARGPAPRRLEDLAGQPIGTIKGFEYPDAYGVLGAGFVRDDAPNVAINLKKLAVGRIEHIIVGRQTFD